MPDLAFHTLKVTSAGLAGLLFATSASVLWGSGFAFAAMIVVAFVAIFAKMDAKFCVETNRAVDGIGIAVVIAITIQSLAWGYLFDSQQGSDFGVYYRCGFDLKPNLAENLNACQSEYIAYGDLYWRRALLSTVPIGWLGGDYFALKLTNAALQGATGALLWSLARRSLGSLPAVVTAIAFALYPDRSFALTLATIDHVALVLTALGLASAACAGRQSQAIALAGAISAGLLIVALDLARSTGLFLLLAAILVLLIRTLPRHGVRFLAAGLATLLTSMFAVGTLANGILSPEGTGDGVLRLASSLHIEASGDVAGRLHWIHHFWPAISPEDRNSVALGRLTDELLMQGENYPAYLLRRAQELTSGYGYVWFAAADLTANRDTVLTAANANVPTWFSTNADLARLWLLPLLGLAFAGALRAPRNELSVAALGFFAASVGVMVFIGEVQARYLLIALPAAALLAGAAFTDRAAAVWVLRVRDFATATAVVAVALCACIGLWAVLRADASAPWARSRPVENGACPTRSDQISADNRQVALRLLAGETCASASFALAPATGRLTFFISDAQFPYRFETAQPSDLAFRVDAGGHVDEGSLETEHVAWRQLPISAGQPTRVVITASRSADRAGEEATMIFAYPMGWR